MREVEHPERRDMIFLVLSSATSLKQEDSTQTIAGGFIVSWEYQRTLTEKKKKIIFENASVQNQSRSCMYETAQTNHISEM